jgi:hypothetical protein
MIRKWNERREYKRKEKERIKHQREKAHKDKLQNTVRASKDKMLDSQCPFQEENKCKESCCHFEHGEVYYDHSFSVHTGVHSYLTFKPCRCKLWK